LRYTSSNYLTNRVLFYFFRALYPSYAKESFLKLFHYSFKFFIISFDCFVFMRGWRTQCILEEMLSFFRLWCCLCIIFNLFQKIDLFLLDKILKGLCIICNKLRFILWYFQFKILFHKLLIFHFFLLTVIT